MLSIAGHDQTLRLGFKSAIITTTTRNHASRGLGITNPADWDHGAGQMSVDECNNSNLVF